MAGGFRLGAVRLPRQPLPSSCALPSVKALLSCPTRQKQTVAERQLARVRPEQIRAAPSVLLRHLKKSFFNTLKKAPEGILLRSFFALLPRRSFRLSEAPFSSAAHMPYPSCAVFCWPLFSRPPARLVKSTCFLPKFMVKIKGTHRLCPESVLKKSE